MFASADAGLDALLVFIGFVYRWYRSYHFPYPSMPSGWQDASESMEPLFLLCKMDRGIYLLNIVQILFWKYPFWNNIESFVGDFIHPEKYPLAQPP